MVKYVILEGASDTAKWLGLKCDISIIGITRYLDYYTIFYKE